MQDKPKTEDILRQLTDRLSGYMGASVVGLDGISVATLKKDHDIDENRAAAALAELVKQSIDVAEAIDAGQFEETITTCEKYLFITRPIGTGKFFLQVILKAGGNIGAARMYMAEYEQALLASLPAIAH